MKILVTGGNGQLGKTIRKVSTTFDSHSFIFTDVEELDISSEKDLNLFFQKFNPDYCINCAGYTAVDKAEEDPEAAFRLNARAVGMLNRVSKKNNTRLIHISTDYVFSGKHYIPYEESDTPDAESVYGKSKLAGEQELSNSSNALIIRTSWLYSEFEANFFDTMSRLMTHKNELKVVFDQVGTPTFATDLADIILTIIERSEKNKFIPGIFHYSNEGVASWYDFSMEIKRLLKADCNIKPVKSEEFFQAAPRPPYSVMNKARIRKSYDIHIPHWRDSVAICFQTRLNNKNL
jgi:dTDP-4-dehydrorhamnose reductase